MQFFRFRRLPTVSIMHISKFHLFFILLTPFLFPLSSSSFFSEALAEVPVSPRANALMAKARPKVEAELAAKGFTLGAPVYMRIFKMPGELEVWIKDGTSFHFFKKYQICCYSGYPGPKLYEGDWQSPEGFYTVSGDQLNPNSLYHLSFDIGYPNNFDKARKRTGSSIMVHGDCSSRGCFAMGDNAIEEIYLLAQSALSSGQASFSLHIFPFRMSSENMHRFRKSPWISFWKDLQQGYSAFETSHQVPAIFVSKGRYKVKGRMKIALTENNASRKKF